MQRTMVYLMGLQRQSLAQRFIALLTAAVMPLCCCVIDAGASCCTSHDEPLVVEIASCCAGSQCQTADIEEPSEEAPCSDTDCSCCLKAPASSFDWTPPVDTIGTDLPPYMAGDLIDGYETSGGSQDAWNDPPPKSGGMDLLRGHVILQV